MMIVWMNLAVATVLLTAIVRVAGAEGTAPSMTVAAILANAPTPGLPAPGGR